MRVVLDTNVLLVSIGRHSPFRAIYDALLRQRLTLIVSTSICWNMKKFWPGAMAR